MSLHSGIIDWDLANLPLADRLDTKLQDYSHQL